MKRFAAALDATRTSRSRIAKEVALGDAFRAITLENSDSDVALATAARLASGRTLPVGDGRALGVGYALLFDVVVAASGFPSDIVRECARRTGDIGEAYGLLVARTEGALARRGVPLDDVAEAFDALASAGSRASKREILDALFADATPLETKYIAKALLNTLRVGAQGGVVEAAIARAFDVSLDDVRRAIALVTDPGVVAVLARDHALGDARFQIGRPVAYMLATPLEAIATPLEPRMLVVEDKIDGIRAQIHKIGNDVTIFARGLEQVTGAFPEVAEAFRVVSGSIALDGELVALSESGRPRPFQSLQPRLNRATPSAAILASTPVTFIAYDLLADDDGAHLDRPWSERRARLEAFARDGAPSRNFVLNACAPLETEGDGAAALEARLDAAVTAARGRGHEGVVLKRIDALYEAGRRGQSWIKVKRAYATLDVVVTAVQEGNGRRAGVLSDYTFGVWRGDEIVNVGKAYSGLTDVEIDALTRRFERMTIERFGGVRIVRPEIVIEVAFDGIQRSKRHKSGFALRFPRIVRVRNDKQPDAADKVDAVEALFEAQLESGHREENAPAAEAPTEPTPRARRGKRASRIPDAQLDLFARKI